MRCSRGRGTWTGTRSMRRSNTICPPRWRCWRSGTARCCRCPRSACFPTTTASRRCSAWLQQLQMESLGKSRRVDGALSDVPTGPVVWGGVGTDAQHTFLQLLRQGTARTAVDIVCVEQPDHGYVEHHKVLVANARAQVEALVAADADSLAANAVSLHLDRPPDAGAPRQPDGAVRTQGRRWRLRCSASMPSTSRGSNWRKRWREKLERDEP